MDNLHSVEKIFSENIFKIPDYQRGYAWEEQQCRDFLEDLALPTGDAVIGGVRAVCGNDGSYLRLNVASQWPVCAGPAKQLET